MKKTLAHRIFNRLVGRLATSVPGSTTLRPFLHRLRGVQINGKVFIGDDVYIENEYPENLTLEDGVQIGLRSTIITHTHGQGSIVISKDVFIGASCVIIAPAGATLTIGEGAVVSAGAVISSDVPPGTLVAPERVKAYAMVTVPLRMDTDYMAFKLGLRPMNWKKDATK
jgi:acetyltransferase-like isoleucine patch superfamily enzyme